MIKRFDPMLNLKFMRIKKGFSQKELAERVGITPVMLSYCESGKRNPSTETLARIAEVLECNMGDLIANSELSKIQGAKISCEELKQAALPLIELLRKKGNQYMTACVTGRGASINEDIIGVPLDYDD